jgi:hypothetical protein
MKLPIRLENAITKLYPAFHNGLLDALDCGMCAVGNMCNGGVNWDSNPLFARNKIFGAYCKEIITDEEIAEGIKEIQSTGYSAEELANVELIFLNACERRKGTKEQQFKGLCAVVEYLCELDNIPNVMDYTKLFETENNQPKYQLTNQIN